MSAHIMCASVKLSCGQALQTTKSSRAGAEGIALYNSGTVQVAVLVAEIVQSLPQVYVVHLRIVRRMNSEYPPYLTLAIPGIIRLAQIVKSS